MEIVKCGINCNVVRLDCKSCRKRISWCVSHQRPTQHNRCTCQEIPVSASAKVKP